jgi:CTP:molybdopterin cytidylyltransferase MocA
MIAAVVLAAGRGVRLGGDVPKPLLTVRGVPFVTRACEAARASGLDPVVCVVSDPRVAAAVPPGVEVVRNEAPERGIASSLRCALEALAPRAEIEAAVVGLADQPLVGPEAYARVGAALAHGAELAYATYGDARGNPVLLARRYWPEACELEGDEGARVLLRRHGAAAVPCDGTGNPIDVDVQADLGAVEQAATEHAWRSQTASE